MNYLRVLNIEDSERDYELLRRHLVTNGVELYSERVETADAMESALVEKEWDLVVCDYSMPTFSAPDALNVLQRVGLDIPFIIISGTVGDDLAVKALKAGASDYLMKDNLVRLIPAIEREMQDAENRRARREAEKEKERLDRELYKERERLRAIVATVPGVVWEALGSSDEWTGGLEFVSDHVEAMLGYSVETWLNTPEFWLTIIHPEDRERIRESAQANYAAGEDWRMEYRWLTKDGASVWVETQVVVIKDGSGKPIGLRGLSLDISERKQAEIFVKESESRFRSLFRAIPIPIWVYDIETLEFLKINDAAIEQYGYSREEFFSMTVKDIRPVEDVARFMFRSETVPLSSGYQGIWKHLRKDGSVFEVEISTHDLQYAGRRCELVTAIDISDRRLAEQELIKSEERYRDLVENAHDIIYSHDLAGNYTSINQAGERITGYPRAEALTLNIADTVSAEYVDRAREMVQAKVAGQESTAYELEIKAKDGHRVSVEVNTKLIEHNGVPVGVQGIARDITERKQLEEQLRQAHQLESVGRLAGGIAHDFNNMLTAINGYCDLTLRQLPEDHRVRRNIEEIRKAGERSAALTNQLLAFSRRQMLQLEIVDLNSVITDTAAMLKRVIGEDVELITSLDPLVGSVKADRGQLSQIIMNLVVNARDAMPTGGKLTIETSNISVEPNQALKEAGPLQGAHVKLAVSDTGTGIPEEDRERIFEPFFTTKDVGKGTGLGLSMVYGILAQSGGHINVISEVGAGSTFEVVFPRATAEAVVAPQEAVNAGRLPMGPETILLVEDEELVRSLLKELLDACGYNILVASDGPSALGIFENNSRTIDLLLTDVVMPRMGGRELAERIQKLRPNLPVLFISGYTDDDVVREGVLESDVDFLQKPFSLETVSLKVRQLLDSNTTAI